MTLNTLTPNVMVKDIESTVEWYERVFGADLVATLPPERDEDPWWAQVVVDDATIMFQERESLEEAFPDLEGSSIGGSVAFYFDVDDAQYLHDELESSEVEIVQELHTTRYGRHQFAVRDCNGYILWFAQKITNEPSGPIVR